MTTYIVLIIGVALLFDFINGFHDAANSVATLVATKAFPHRFYAVLWAAFWNFIAFKFLGTGVAKAIGKDIIEPIAINPTVILSGLIGAIVWNLYTWYKGIPSSSSHALMGGFAGGAIAHANSFGALIGPGWVKPVLFIIIAPMVGFFLSKFLLWMVNLLVRKIPEKTVNKNARWFQYFSAAAFSFGHGANDAQKTMGIITALLVSVGYLKDFHVPIQVVLLAHAAIALGTLFGGWRIVHTLAHGITKKDMRPHEGFCAETAAALCLIPATLWKVPLSTTHTITGAITGIGASNGGRSNLTEKKLWEILKAWLATMVVSAGMAALCYYSLSQFNFR